MDARLLYLGYWNAGCIAGVFAGILVLRARGALGVRTVMALGVAWGGLLLGAKWEARLEAGMSLRAALLVPWGELLGSGFRLPLGLLTGGLLAALWCISTRAPWRETGDALAVAASVLIPIGRIGCLAYGCCMGVECGPWMKPFCTRFKHVRDHLVPAAVPLPGPVHPLPLYFAIASLATLAVLLWLLDRGVFAGSLLLAFCILRPATKLALEPLRADAVPGSLILGVPGAVLAVASAVAVRLLIRRTLGVSGIPPRTSESPPPGASSIPRMHA